MHHKFLDLELYSCCVILGRQGRAGRSLEALSVYNGGTALVIFFLCDPHLRENVCQEHDTSLVVALVKVR